MHIKNHINMKEQFGYNVQALTTPKYISLITILIVLFISQFIIISSATAKDKVVVIPLYDSSNKVVKKTITVPTEFPTIQSAIDAANENDTINILSGNYNETLIIKKDNLTLNGSGKNVTKISGNGTDDTIFINNSRNITIKNLLIRNGKRGIVIGYSSVYLSNLRIENNNNNGLRGIFNSYINADNIFSKSNSGAGLDLSYSSSAYITNSKFSGNGAGGIFVARGSAIIIDSCKLWGNQGSGIQAYLNANATITDCEITSNNNIGVDITVNSTGIFYGPNIISGNADSSGWRSGIGVFHNSHAAIHDNIEILRNKGPGVYISNNSSFFMYGGIIDENQGHGIVFHGDSVGQFESSSPISITDNRGYGINCDDGKISGDTGSISFSNNDSGAINCP